MLIVPSPAVATSAQIGVLVLGSRSAGYFEDSSRTALRVMARSLSMELHAWRLAQSRHELIRRAQTHGHGHRPAAPRAQGLPHQGHPRHLRMTAPAIDSRFQRAQCASRRAQPQRRRRRLAATYGLV
jgi:hypothetical protein